MNARPFSLLAALVLLTSLAGAQLSVVSVTPGMNATNVARDADVVIDFDRALSASALPPQSDDIAVFASNGGAAAGTFSLENGGARVRFQPSADWFTGERVHVMLSNALTATDGSTLRPEGFSASFRVVSGVSALSYREIQTIDVHLPNGSTTRPYGGQATDLDGDGWVDVAVVNEDTSDVRVHLSLADGSGRLDDALDPPNDTGSVPSPNESADLNGDGFTDLVTANVSAASVSVLLGAGDGTFGPRQDFSTGGGPHGLALLDADGDGDLDIATANTSSDNVALLANDGAGAFGAPSFFEGGGNDEYALAAADMNNDGIGDLVVGARASGRVIVHLGNGDGTFTQAGMTSGVGAVWMIVCGDVNGDGLMDVSTANSGSGTGSILLGSGDGIIGLASVVNASNGVVATDLGDMDGDGDLDWMLSAFSGGRWTLFVNDGNGNMAFDQEFLAPANPACSVLVDVDRDRDLDIVFFDEIANLLIVMESHCVAQNFCQAETNSTGSAAQAGFAGSCVVADNDLTLLAGPVPDNFGLFFFGAHPASETPVGNGNFCLTNPVYRSDIGLAIGGVLAVPLDLTVWPVPAAVILPGTTWYFQAVFRDPLAGGAEFNFSDGLELGFL